MWPPSRTAGLHTHIAELGNEAASLHTHLRPCSNFNQSFAAQGVTHGGVPVVEPILLGFVFKKDDGKAAAVLSGYDVSTSCPFLPGEWEAPDVPVFGPQAAASDDGSDAAKS